MSNLWILRKDSYDGDIEIIAVEESEEKVRDIARRQAFAITRRTHGDIQIEDGWIDVRKRGESECSFAWSPFPIPPWLKLKADLDTKGQKGEPVMDLYDLQIRVKEGEFNTDEAMFMTPGDGWVSASLCYWQHIDDINQLEECGLRMGYFVSKEKAKAFFDNEYLRNSTPQHAVLEFRINKIRLFKQPQEQWTWTWDKPSG